MHGTTDAGTFGDYVADFAQWRSDIIGDAQLITGQVSGPKFMIDQIGWGALGSAVDSAGVWYMTEEQLAIVDAHADVWMRGPRYNCDAWFPDTLHGDGMFYWDIGSVMANIATEIEGGADWEPLRPTAATANGNTVVLDFDVPVTPVVLSSELPAPLSGLGTQEYENEPNYGFQYYDDGVAAIESVAVTGPSQVTLYLDGAPIVCNADRVDVCEACD